jgi:hypothetical protein
MARTVAGLAEGTRIADFISLGVISKVFPVETIREILAQTGRASRREQDLPAQVMVYYVIALALYMQVSCREVLRCLTEGLRWLHLPGGDRPATGKSGISQARTRLGEEPVRRLHDAVVRPVAEPRTKGAWYRRWRLASLVKLRGLHMPLVASRRFRFHLLTCSILTCSAAHRAARRPLTTAHARALEPLSAPRITLNSKIGNVARGRCAILAFYYTIIFLICQATSCPFSRRRT